MGKPLDPQQSHRITLPEAAEKARAHRQGGPARAGDAGAFNAQAIKDVLAQPGCVGLRYYKGRGKEGSDTMILVGVNESGDDMTEGVLLQVPFLCPPYCSNSNSLNT